MLSPAPAHDKRRPCLIFALLLVTLLITGCADFKPFTPLHPGEALQGDKEIFTGRVVLVPEGYRLHLANSDDLVRLTRAGNTGAFELREVNLRKYYEKTLAVRGARRGEWLWRAQIVGQWVRPGDSRGPNLLAPPVGQH